MQICVYIVLIEGDRIFLWCQMGKETKTIENIKDCTHFNMEITVYENFLLLKLNRHYLNSIEIFYIFLILIMIQLVAGVDSVWTPDVSIISINKKREERNADAVLQFQHLNGFFFRYGGT